MLNARRECRAARDAYTVEGTGDPDGVLPDRVFGGGQKFEFLASLDFLVLAVPLTRSTEGMIGEDELRALPRSAYLLNPARGRSSSTRPLCAPCRKMDRRRGARHALPVPDAAGSPALEYSQCDLHAAYRRLQPSPRFRERLWEIFVTNALRFARGEPLLNELSPDDLNGD